MENRRPVKITATIGSKTYTGDLEAEARIIPDFTKLNEELAENPAKFAWWATLEVLAKTQVEELTTRKDTIFAELYTQYESTLANLSDRRPTVDAIKSMIFLDDSYKKAVEDLRKATESERLMTVARQTMQARKDSLVAVASNLRAEATAGLSAQMQYLRDLARNKKTGRASGTQ